MVLPVPSVAGGGARGPGGIGYSRTLDTVRDTDLPSQVLQTCYRFGELCISFNKS